MKHESAPIGLRKRDVLVWAAEVALLAASAILYLAYSGCNWGSLCAACRNLPSAFP